MAGILGVNNFTMEYVTSFNCAVRGYHIYKDLLNPVGLIPIELS